MLNLYAHLGTTTIGRIHYVESGPDWTAFQATEAHWPAAAEPGWAPSELVPFAYADMGDQALGTGWIERLPVPGLSPSTFCQTPGALSLCDPKPL
jgi:hypothetical protein